MRCVLGIVLERSSHVTFEILGETRFREKHVGACFERAALDSPSRIASEQDDRDATRVAILSELGGDADSIKPGHRQVEHDDVRSDAVRDLHRGFAVRSRQYPEAHEMQVLAVELPNIQRVVDKQHERRSTRLPLRTPLRVRRDGMRLERIILGNALRSR